MTFTTNSDKTYYVYVGYDPREKEVYQACKYSIEKYNKNKNVIVKPLIMSDLREMGLYTRPYRVDEKGQFIDELDGRPFSTQFTFTRFLTPHLHKNLNTDPNKSELCLFMDSDMIVLDDIEKLFKMVEEKKLMTNGKSSVYCVQHDYSPTNTVKMDGMKQFAYNMKLWAAFMVFDTEHKETDELTVDIVNSAGGRDLMNFFWVENPHTIGSLPEQWHFIPNHSEKNVGFEAIKMIHWTEGGPNFKNKRGGKYDRIWWEHFNEFYLSKIKKVVMDCEGIIDL